MTMTTQIFYDCETICPYWASHINVITKVMNYYRLHVAKGLDRSILTAERE